MIRPMIRPGTFGSILAIALVGGCTFETQPPAICSFEVSGPVSTDTTSIPITGVLHSSTAPLTVSWRILRGSDELTNKFRISFTPPGATPTDWDLAEQGHTRLQNLSAPADTYTLVATLVDGDGVTTVSSTGFRVLPGCKGQACGLPLPEPSMLQGMGTQTALFALLSLQDQSINWFDAPGLPQDRIDLLLRWETDHLEFVSPAADSALDSRIASWTKRNATLVVPASMTITSSTTPRDILAEIAQHPGQIATATAGGTYLVQCADGSVGWLRVSAISGTGINSIVDLTFSVALVPRS